MLGQLLNSEGSINWVIPIILWITVKDYNFYDISLEGKQQKALGIVSICLINIC